MSVQDKHYASVLSSYVGAMQCPPISHCTATCLVVDPPPPLLFLVVCATSFAWRAKPLTLSWCWCHFTMSPSAPTTNPSYDVPHFIAAISRSAVSSPNIPIGSLQ